MNGRMICGLWVLALAHFGVAEGVGAAAADSGCARFETRKELLGEDDLAFVRERVLAFKEEEEYSPYNPALLSLWWGKFFHERGGYCAPTNDTYLVAKGRHNVPRIIMVFTGHTPRARIHELQGEKILLLFYFAGGNAYLLQPYRFALSAHGFAGLEPIEVEGRHFNNFYSNMRSIEVAGDEVVARFQQRYRKGHSSGIELTTESYRYEGGGFVLQETGTETIPDPN